jgi:mannose-6-phosphate isomerase-like protein (cupin superfamily)
LEEMKIDVVRRSKLKIGYSTPGIVREKAFESTRGYNIVSRTRVSVGAVSDWHHHGTRHLYGFIEAGRMRLEYGLNGHRSVEVRQGDFFHIPPHLVHRDINPDKKLELAVVNILVGRGKPVINVKGPSRA